MAPTPLGVSIAATIASLVLLFGVLVTGLVLDGAAPRGSTTPTSRRPSYYERVKQIVESYEAGRISAVERDRRLKEITE